ncbi:MAG TPA: GntR family transcriptional regulator [Candidatus Coproplasma excrementipullorum]|nr:GntR family transcriptional regulator [Candidatus Coproplasma excrementipullorum]
MKAPKMSLFLVIGENIKRRIAAGMLKEGDKLPSCREFAEELGVNPNTVQRAYTQLEEEGVVFTIAKKGVFVSSARRPRPDRGQMLLSKIAELKNLGYTREEIESAVATAFDDHITV